MSNTRLFDVPKIQCFCDAVAHGTERRRGEQVKVLKLTLRVAPFDSKLATAMPDGVKPILFKLNTGDPKETLRRADFALGLSRQKLTVFASTDTDPASIAFDQVKIGGTYALQQKDRNGFDFVFRASFGPVGRDELEYVQSWLLTQRSVTFDEAEPGMFDTETDGDEDADPITDADEKARQPPTPMFDTETDGRPIAPARESAHRKLHTHGGGKKKAGRATAKTGRRLRRRR